VTTDNGCSGRIEILPVLGVAELRPHDDLVAEIARCAPWLEDGDILVVTSKAVSKIEGRLREVPAGAEQREAIRQGLIDEETVRVVAQRGTLRIVETRNGLVLAAAGVDSSNVQSNELALLPVDPDASANRLRDGIRDKLGVSVAVVISDSMGRPWRHGITDIAIGVAGIAAVTDERGAKDKHGNVLVTTEVAVADELAAAADLVKGKLADIPVAVVRGLTYADDSRGSSTLQRGIADDLFRMGTAEALALGHAQAWSGSINGSSTNGSSTNGDGPARDSVAAQVVALHADVLATIATMRLDAGDGTGQSAVREAFYSLLAARPDATRRACAPGHVTASTVLLDHEARRVLLTLHPRVGAWLQLGGHCEDTDLSLGFAAAREALEESGIHGIQLDPLPIDLDIHPITCSLGLPTRHFDVRFVGRAPLAAEAVISSESDDLQWFDVDKLPSNIAPELPRLIRRAVQHARSRS
jgi:coenzyme F420-0:L-glutamate ligase